MQTLPWRYVGEATSARVAALANPRPNGELGQALRAGLKLECFHRQTRDGDPAYHRAVFCGRADEMLIDGFFNASSGYRGAFFQSAADGTRVNQELLEQLAPFLAKWAEEGGFDDGRWIRSSLAKPSAKLWLAEHPGICSKCESEWQASSTAKLRIENSRWEHSSHVHAEWGRQAPRLSKIRVFGGFIDAQDNEWLACHKETRAEQIWEHGWS